jgi:hypothetical protein
VSIIRKYERWLAYWTTQVNRGQANAINRGIARMTGNLFNWINSDDLLLPRALWQVAAAHGKWPDAVLAFDVLGFWNDEPPSEYFRQQEISLTRLVQLPPGIPGTDWSQQGLFCPAGLLHRVGTMDESMEYAFDYDYFCRLLAYAELKIVNEPVAAFRFHPNSKTVSAMDFFYLDFFRAAPRYRHLVADFDERRYRRHVAEKLFKIGLRRLTSGQRRAMHFVRRGLRADPLWALWASASAVARYLLRKFTRGR